jgi:hypothetical protein
MPKHTILFLAANPRGTDRRALDREARSIQEELKRSDGRDCFELKTRWAVGPLDLLRELRELKPAVVHFSGHGSRRGLVFEASDGDARIVSPEAIQDAFGAAGASVHLVVLSACHSEATAEALLAHVDHVVYVGNSIAEDAARSFAIGFYGALAQHSIATACAHGGSAISLEGAPDGERPQLRTRDEIDATQPFLAAIAPPTNADLPCPYPGMRPYTVTEAAHFYGRDAEVEDLLGRLRTGEREIYVVGPSGSGKSSLVEAGVLPRLARGVTGLRPFVVLSMRPGEHPAARLGELLGEPAPPANAVAALLAHHTPDKLVLIVVDQLEELFTLAEPIERELFLDALQGLRAEDRCVVVFTLRADFFGTFMESPLWTENQRRISRVEVGPLRGKLLRDAIVQPAARLGVQLEPALIERLLADVGTESGVLPLLQETLVQLWDRREDQTLTLAAYQAVGDGDRSGLAMALSRRADAALRALTAEQEAIARRILLRLVSFREGHPDIRRQQSRSSLRAASDDDADFDAVLQHLIAHRLLITKDHGGEAHIDLAHEVLIVAWPTLADWIQTRRADEQRRRQLETAAARWVEQGRGVRGLLDEVDLAKAEAWRHTETARELGESADVGALIAASGARHRRIRRLVRGTGAGMILLLTVIAATAISVAGAQEQELQRDVLRTNAYAARALAGTVALHLRENVDAAVATAADPEVERAIRSFDDQALEQRRTSTPFDTLALYDRSGMARVQASADPLRRRNLGMDYSWRDYYFGARRLGEAGLRAGYISRALLSETEGIWMFGIAAPVYDGDRWAGVLLATLGTDSALGRQRLDRTSEDGPMAVIVAPRDRSRTTTAGEGEYVVILHDGLIHGLGVVMDSPRLRELRVTRTERDQLRWRDPETITDDAHRDPVPGYEGQWLAGFAPVADTGFVVIVQTRHSAAVAPNVRLLRRLGTYTGVVLLLWLVAVGAIWRRHAVTVRRTATRFRATRSDNHHEL